MRGTGEARTAREKALQEDREELRAGVRDRVAELIGPEGTELERPAGAPAAVPLAAPASDEEAGAVLRAAAEEGWRVLPMGSGLGLDLLPAAAPGGGPGPDLLLSTARLRGISDYEPADLTLTAAGGTNLGAVDGETAKEGQCLPMDPPGGGGVTLGAAASMGVGGSLTTGFGRPRDHVLGLVLVDGRGRVLPLGGRVVKNVAGFDLVRLVSGSRGALGLVTSVSVRLFPRPFRDRTLVWEVPEPSDARVLARRLSLLPLPLAALELLFGDWTGGTDEGAVPGRGMRILARVQGSTSAADRMAGELEKVAGPRTDGWEGEGARRGFEALGRLDGRGELALRCRVLPERGVELLEAAEALSRDLAGPAGGGLPEPRGAYRVRTGELRLTWEGVPPGGAVPDGAAERLRSFREGVRGLGGSWRLLRSPGTLPSSLAAAPVPSDGVTELRRRLRLAFDPAGVLPGAWREGW